VKLEARRESLAREGVRNPRRASGLIVIFLGQGRAPFVMLNVPIQINVVVANVAVKYGHFSLSLHYSYRSLHLKLEGQAREASIPLALLRAEL
jgi:hypothetical protein